MQPLMRTYYKLSCLYRVAGWMACLLSLPYALQAQQRQSTTTTVLPADSITLYLSFDDGIIPASEALNELANTMQVPLTVCWIGQFVLHNDTTRRIWKLLQSNPFIESGNHSFSHANSHYYKFYQDPQQVLADFRKNQDSLQFTTKLARLPGRNVWRLYKRQRDDLVDAKPVADSLALAGYSIFGWDIEWYYTTAVNQLEPAGELLFRIGQALQYHRTFTSRQVVILCHDPALTNTNSLATLRQFIRLAQQSGYRFRFLSQYPGYAPSP